jgi:hypothetical protein
MRTSWRIAVFFVALASLVAIAFVALNFDVYVYALHEERDGIRRFERDASSSLLLTRDHGDLLIVWDGSRRVFRCNHLGRNVLGLLVWEKTAYTGAPIGDRVKGDGDESFEFGADAVRITTRAGAGPLTTFIIPRY